MVTRSKAIYDRTGCDRTNRFTMRGIHLSGTYAADQIFAVRPDCDQCRWIWWIALDSFKLEIINTACPKHNQLDCVVKHNDATSRAT